MVVNPVSLTRKSPLLYRFLGSSLKPISQFGQQIRVPVNPAQISVFRGCSTRSLNFGHGTGFNSLGSSKMGFGQLGFDSLRFSAAAEGVPGGAGGGGGFGGSGDGNSGGGRSEGGGSGASGGGSNWSFLSWYLALLAKHPVSTKAVDICTFDFDWRLNLPGGLYLNANMFLSFTYLYLSKLVTLPGASGAFLRLLLDQFIFSPIFIGVFLSTLLTLEGRPGQVVAKLQQEWFSSVLANWQLWIPFQFLNFRFVPQQFQVLAANVVALVWNVILSFKAHKEVLPK
ncbi:hypothetical protein Pint_18410 [Pistacia integerrima]|uniref:Uncharacterized protein n=1 Tax=Pistacia integerrima TaxID=434235 RepID=A0ACC0YX01_9ROSI|nr:hypothetical protein Pint_18410 [Pistacia integerrima]